MGVLVVGGGAMGSAAAWQLARRGHEVLLLERFGPGHDRGASHGATRNFNTAYAEPVYADLVQEARGVWRELEEQTGRVLLDLVGLVNHGWLPPLQAAARALAARGQAVEFLDAAEAAERWPGMRFRTRVLHVPGAGRVRARDAVSALQQAARDAGAQVRHTTRVEALRVLGEDAVAVDTDAGRLTARRVVVTAGAWTADLLTGLLPLPALTTTQEQPAHFRPLDGSGPWPSFNHLPDPDAGRDRWWHGPVYGMLTPGEGVKAGWHHAGPGVHPDTRDFRPEPRQLAALRRYAAEWLPGVDPADCTPLSCLYTSTDTEDFLLDRGGPLAVGAGFSGHGFQFAPAVGRILADLVEGGEGPARFRLHR